MEFLFKVIPSTEKCFLDEKIEDKKELTSLTMLKNERLDFQVAYAMKDNDWHSTHLTLELESDIKEFITVYRVEQVPVTLPKSPYVPLDGYLRDEPGLYPDLLIPMKDQYKLIFAKDQLRSLYVSVENKEGLPAGDHKIVFKAMAHDGCCAEAEMTIRVIDAALPKQSLIHTEWFHSDCLANYYDVEVFSEAHWSIVRNFLEEARETGVNMILTPVFTPPLDTYVGGERRTVQLVDVTVTDDGYKFGYEKLDRWVKMCLELGFEYFEISHLFTQWGCYHAPKIMATVKGEEKRIFGWETDSHGEEYTAFVRAFLTDFVAHVKELGVDQMCYYHISDEPYGEHLESYLKAKEAIIDIIGSYHQIDALSEYEFYESGAVKNPIPASDRIKPFLENKVPNLWVYYCVSQCYEVSNRFVSMPGARTRSISLPIFKYDIEGFLQWGFNFYNCQYSNYPINPFQDPCGEYFAPAGDAFVVYPGPKGVPYRSLHGVQFYQALTDLRALQYLSSLVGKERVMEIMEEGVSTPITFSEYPMDQEYYLNLRERVNAEIEKALA